jgi:DNA-binding IclR family transcriptional regulator
MQMTIVQGLLVLVYRSARVGRRANLTAFCQRTGASAAELQAAFDRLEAQGLISFNQQGERLTLEGLAVAAALALAQRQQARARPLAACRSLAA